MLALRDHTVWNCHDVGLKVDFIFILFGKVQAEWLYSDIYHCKNCISIVSVVIGENTCCHSVKVKNTSAAGKNVVNFVCVVDCCETTFQFRSVAKSKC
jgi:hypothetical protein